MTGAVPSALAERLAQECRTAASSLLRLQETLGFAIPNLEITPRLVEDLQSLDTVAQTMDDLGAVFDAIAASTAPGECPNILSDAVLSSVSQASLRQRLAGAAERGPERDVDLF